MSPPAIPDDAPMYKFGVWRSTKLAEPLVCKGGPLHNQLLWIDAIVVYVRIVDPVTSKIKHHQYHRKTLTRNPRLVVRWFEHYVPPPFE